MVRGVPNAPIGPFRPEDVSDMEQSQRGVVTRGVQTGTLLKGCAYAMEHNHRHVMLQDVPNFAKGRVCVKDIMKKNIVIGSLVVMRGVQDKVVKEGYVCFMVLFRNCLANIRDVPTDKLGVNKDFVGDMAQRRDKEDQQVRV